MNVVHDDIIYNLQKKGGITNYWKNLKLFLEYSISLKNINGNSEKESKIPTSLLRYINSNIRSKKKFIFHSSYYRTSNSKNAINIITVYDFIYEKFSTGWRKKIHVWQKEKAINKSDHIICISNSTKNDLLTYYPEVIKSKITVVYLGVSNTFTYNYKSKKNKSLIFVGSRKGYKNFRILLDAMKKLKNYNLTLIGGGKLSNSEIKILDNINYQHTIDCNDQRLNQLYNESFALVYPSLYEGFGLPIIEALKAGCPVICSDGSSTGEIGGDYVISGKMTPEFIINSVLSLENDLFRNELVKEGIKYASSYKWEKTAEETLKIYYELWEKFQ
tara:strand:- start:272 stop:1264 length:993 start_codon:yes stop_codon:yes gene_type:complete